MQLAGFCRLGSHTFFHSDRLGYKDSHAAEAATTNATTPSSSQATASTAAARPSKKQVAYESGEAKRLEAAQPASRSAANAAPKGIVEVKDEDHWSSILAAAAEKGRQDLLVER
jgi:hypothetical protein